MFYVDPIVDVGASVAVGQMIGASHSLQKRYPRGMTDHVHLELTNQAGRRFAAIDAARLDAASEMAPSGLTLYAATASNAAAARSVVYVVNPKPPVRWRSRPAG